MRNNQPVYDREYTLLDEQYLISRTDTRGRIIYANPAFVEVSGYALDELMGAAHNIVRHPDMPEDVFADLWRTLEQGESWTGLIKNRRKDGGYYWVLASVVPVTERGETVCYASVRVKASRKQIDTANRVYAQLRAGSAPGVRLHRGTVQHAGQFGFRSTLLPRSDGKPSRPTSFQARMLAWATLTSALFLGAGGTTLYAMADRLQPQEFAIGAAGLAAGACVIFASAWSLARSITRRLTTAADFTRQIAAGNLSTPLPSSRLDDELGELEFALEVMRKSLISITRDVHHGIKSTLQTASSMADGNEDPSAQCHAAQMRHAIEVFRLASRRTTLPELS